MNQEYDVISNGEVVGSMSVARSGNAIDVSHHVHNNGRGARLDEHIRLHPSGIPASWTIAGNSMMGGVVDEEFHVKAGIARWRSQADSGEIEAGTDRVYVPSDGTPFSFALVLELALRDGGSIETLPSGRAVAELVETLDEIGVDLYSLSGVALEPIYLLRTDDGLFAGLFEQDGLTLLPHLTPAATEIRAARDRQIRRRLLSISAAVSDPAPTGLVLRDVHVFDAVAGQFGERVDIRVEGQVIVTVGADAEARAGDTVIDGAGRYVIPGLHDMHAHLSGPDALLYVAAGVTSVRDMGNDHDRLSELVAQIDAGALVGPTVVGAGFIEGRSEHAMRLGKVVGSLDEALAAVDWYAERGYRRIKLYNSFHREWIRPVAEDVHRRGMTVFGHVPAFVTPDEVIEDGYDEITHLNQLVLGWVLEPGEDTRTPLRATALARVADLDLDSPRVRRTIDDMIAKGIGVDTTAVIIERLLLSRAGRTMPGDESFLSHMPIAYQRYRRRTYLPFDTEADLEAYDRAFPRLLEIIRMLDDEGIDLWPGTDDGTGFTVHREIELYVEAGLTPARALQRATVASAAHLDLDETHGRITPGFAADLVVLDDDPTQDIGAIRRVALTVLRGRPFAPARIHQQFGIEPFAAAPSSVIE
ncbi:amidohydrolase family protein [Microbacterium forte]